MLLLSWNAAGFSTTAKRIHSSYKPNNTGNEKSGRRAAPADSILEFFRRHQADIVCLQEHKIPRAQLSSRSEPLGCSTVEGYESFWSCCVDKDKRGLNGVVTYARSGLVRSADAFALRKDDLDSQGRCIMTDHGDFVLFNVYVPCSGGHSTSSKMRFLGSLRQAMKKQRENNKPVVLVGDLNITHAPLDLFWKDRVIHVNDVLNEVAMGTEKDNLPQWKTEVFQAWPKILAAFETREVRATQTTNTLTGEKFDKFRLSVLVGNQRVYLGKHESTKEYCLWNYDFSGSTYICPETDAERVASEANVISVGTLSELMAKIGGIDWDVQTQRMISTHHAGVRRTSPPRKWLNDILHEDGMVDVFRHLYPTAEARFTCWNQFTNRRYSNEGTRIDYTLVDKCLLDRVRKGDVKSLRCPSASLDPLSEEAALSAATANGAFKPVSFEGEGISEVAQRVLDTQFGCAHTGMVYTPPSFSDHIGVSLLMDGLAHNSKLELDDRDSATRKAQPHKMQKSLASFFSANASKETKAPIVHEPRLSKPKRDFFVAQRSTISGQRQHKRSKVSKAPKGKKPPAKNKTNTILHHFKPPK